MSSTATPDPELLHKLIRKWSRMANDLMPDTTQFEDEPIRAEINEAASIAYQSCAAQLKEVIEGKKGD